MSTAEFSPQVADEPETVVDLPNARQDDDFTVHTQSVFDEPDEVTWLGAQSAGLRMTTAEFRAVEDWDEFYRFELIRGVVVVSPPAGAGERGPNGRLDQWLWNYHDDHSKGSSLDDTLTEQEIDTGHDTLRRADRVIWAGLGRQPNINTDTPTIVIEIVSNRPRDQRRDYDDKRTEYAAIGVKEYWIFDRYRRTLTICEGDEVSRIVKESETYESPLLPGFVLDVGKLLAVADRYEQPEETE